MKTIGAAVFSLLLLAGCASSPNHSGFSPAGSPPSMSPYGGVNPFAGLVPPAGALDVQKQPFEHVQVSVDPADMQSKTEFLRYLQNPDWVLVKKEPGSGSTTVYTFLRLAFTPVTRDPFGRPVSEPTDKPPVPPIPGSSPRQE